MERTPALPSGDLLLTGGTGFLGSHILLSWLLQNPHANVACLARGRDLAAGRVEKALATAAFESGVNIDLKRLMGRVAIINGSVEKLCFKTDPGVDEWIQRSIGFHVIHCAANLSFRDEDREAVFSSNVDGTKRVLKQLEAARNLISFNYVSTAYVSGTKEGSVREDESAPPRSFNNVYEESKWLAESIVRTSAIAASPGARIFRPSIIIGHSATKRITAVSGFYKVLDTLRQLHHLRPGHADAIQIPSKRQASLNLIPVDIVAAELLHVIGCGASTLGKTFHLTNERPLSIADIFFGVTPLTGTTLKVVEEGSTARRDAVSALVIRGLKHYMPYLTQERTFDRSNIRACGASVFQDEYWLDLMRLCDFARNFLTQPQEVSAQLEEVSA